MKRFILYLLPVLLVLGIVRPAHADGEPIEGRDYWILPSAQCPTGTCVKIAPGININTPRLAQKLGVKPIDVRRDNPLGTIALCHRPGDGYRMASIAKPEDRASDEIWKSCPEPERQYVYILPGQTVRLSGKRHLSFREEEQLKLEVRNCTTVDCAVEVARKWGAKIPASAGAPVPVQGSDPIVAKLTACTTPECSVAVANEAGANIKLSQGDKLLSALVACGENDAACRNRALQENGLAPIRPATPVDNAESVVEVQVLPGWVGKALAFLGAVALVFAVLYLRLRTNTADRVARAVEDERRRHDSLLQERDGEISSLKLDVKEKAGLLAQRLEEISKISMNLEAVRTSLVAMAKRESVPVPQDLSTPEILTLLGQHFAGVARENGELRETKRRAEQAADEAGANLQKQVEINEKLAKDLTDKAEQARAGKSSVDDWQRNRDRCRELFGLIAPKAGELIAVDNELTELYEPHEALVEQFRILEGAGDPQAGSVRTEILSLEQRIKDLVGKRDALMEGLDSLRPEFEALHERQAGFRLDESQLYNEAQRDRNDAGKERGRAKALHALTQAQAEALSVREAAVVAKEQELAEREITVGDREAAVKHLLRPLLNVLCVDAGITLAQLKEQGGIEALMQRHAEAYEKLRGAYAQLQRRYEQLEAGQATPSMRVPGAAPDRLQTLEILLQDRDRTIAWKDAAIVSLTNELDNARAQVEADRETIASLERRVAELEPFETAAKGSLKPSPIPRDLAAAVAEDEPRIELRLDEVHGPDEPVPTSISRRTMTYHEKPMEPHIRAVPSAGTGPAEPSPADEFFDLARQLVAANRPLRVDSAVKVRTLQLLLHELPAVFDFDGIFGNGSPFSANAKQLLHTRGEEFVRGRLTAANNLLSGIQWFLETCGIPEHSELPPQTNRAWTPG